MCGSDKKNEDKTIKNKTKGVKQEDFQQYHNVVEFYDSDVKKKSVTMF